MGSTKPEKNKKPSRNPKPFAPNKPKSQSKFKKTTTTTKKKKNSQNDTAITKTTSSSLPASPSQQLTYFLSQFESVNGVHLSSLELESIKDSCILDVSKELGQDVTKLEKHIKAAFGAKWKEQLCEGKLIEGEIEAGNPTVLVVAPSALRAIELLRGMRSLTEACHAVKLFSKHMKVDEQVSLLKSRVNIAGGTPSRIKKLIDIEALGLSRLSVLLLDIQPDAKGYSLLTLPQVRDEFWDFYKNYFHQQVVRGDLRICLYGPIPNVNEIKGKSVEVADDGEQLDS